MLKNKITHVKCILCKKHFLKGNLVPVKMLKHAFRHTLEEEVPHLSTKGFICMADVKRTWRVYLRTKKKQPPPPSEEVITLNINEEYEETSTFGERVADSVSAFGGSWLFLGWFTFFIFLWMVFNALQFLFFAFDPYPYIFLNLILSCLAAVQAPVIMMSQNRHAAKDRLRIEYDYAVNLKAAREIEEINQKLDHFIKDYQEKQGKYGKSLIN